MTVGSSSPHPAGSPWRGVLLLVLAGMIVGLGPAGILFGLALAGMALERTAPELIDKAIDRLTF